MRKKKKPSTAKPCKAIGCGRKVTPDKSVKGFCWQHSNMAKVKR